jgi:RRXRR protein
VINEVSGEVVWAAELQPRGQQVKQRLAQRHTRRWASSVRQSHAAHRRAPPSLESRLANVLTWGQRLRRWCPIAALSQEVVKFDMQLMQDAEISGVE